MTAGQSITFVGLVLTFVLLATLPTGAAERIELWPDGAPGALGTGKQDRPTVTVHRPAGLAEGAPAVVLCPGGGYKHLSGIGMYLPFFESLGVVVFHLEYRLPVHGYRHPAPLQDAQRALRFARANAVRYGVDPARIGVLGFSSGGHLASTTGTHFQGSVPDGKTALDRVSDRPDFMILLCPVISMTTDAHRPSVQRLLGPDPSPQLARRLSGESQVTPRTPPTFLGHARDDGLVKVENSMRFHDALRTAGVESEIYLAETGGHGFMRQDPHWRGRLTAWMKKNGFVGAGPDPAPAKRLNILFVMSDDHTSQAVGCYGSRLASLDPTPTIDRLAREGMRFDRVFCTNSICVPSRANIMTGQHCQRNGVLDLYESLPPEKQYLAHEMKKAGYQTSMIGKWHLKANPSAFDYYCVLPAQGKYFDPIMYSNDGKGELRKVRYNSRLTREIPVQEFKGHSSDVITDVALDWFRHGRDPDRPFFMMLHYKAPHDMFRHARRYDSYLVDVKIPEPDNLHDQPAPGAGSVATRGPDDSLVSEIGSSVSKRMRHRDMGRHMRVDRKLPDREYTEEAYQRYLKRYLRCVKGVDDNLARVLAYLKENGLLESTVIVYTGDQGFMLGEHDYIDKRWMYEESMRMPFIVRHPGGKPGSTNDWLINNTDFAPTLLELAGAETPEYMQGRSFAGALRGVDRPADWRTSTYYRYWMHMAHGHRNPAHFGIRTDRYKLIFFYGTDHIKVTRKGELVNQYGPDTPVAWEFYDLEKDPREMKNAYGDPDYQEIIAGLKDELRRKRQELGETDKKYPRIQAIIDNHWSD